MVENSSDPFCIPSSVISGELGENHTLWAEAGGLIHPLQGPCAYQEKYGMAELLVEAKS